MSGRLPDDDVTAPSGKALPREDSVSEDPLIGTMLGDYRVEQRLGHGGMGALYRAVQPLIGRQVAIKVLLPEAVVFDPASEERMLAEARAANVVRHPNLLEVFSFGSLPDGRPYMVMELLEGRSLAEELDAAGKLTWQQTVRVLREVMAALEAAHAAGVVHRDLKPGNIFVTDSPDGWRIKVIDFGLARRAQDNRLTRPGMVMGTPAFMAPEQVRGSMEVGPPADIYSMGIVGWTLLMGHAPYEAEALMDILQGHLSQPVPALAGIGEVPASLEALLGKMMAKEAAQRPTASQVRAQLAAVKESKPPSMALALVGVVAALAATAFALLQSEPPPSPSPVPVVKPTVVVPPPPVRTVEPPPQPEPVAPAPIEPAKLEGYEHAWRCSDVASVTPVLKDGFSQWQFFSVAFEHERSLVVYGDGKNKKQVALLSKRREEVAACRDATLGAKRVDLRHVSFRTDLVTQYGGDVVGVEDLAIVAPKP